ncbi:hypothetical protein BRPE64_ACDS18720 [Caballeronia insecticola]|uniref:Uncharacterized protein n=1 Tax=Caballeronia insecticola TaxID=758793 RepID=R4WX95_9BURK|nr:hypothetical protein BRPE64_ACDS18720 [Caballeronia insecticola]
MRIILNNKLNRCRWRRKKSSRSGKNVSFIGDAAKRRH